VHFLGAMACHGGKLPQAANCNPMGDDLAHYRRLVVESERDPARNEVQHNWLLKLLADAEAEESKPLDRRH
jgi:hypothetical protein